MNIALLGPSGVGKGTHALALCTRFRLRHVATGDLFRHNVVTRTALGRLAQKYMRQGELVPDEIVDAMIDEWGDTLGEDEGALFDGFPRTTDQVKFLAALLGRLQRELDAVVYLHVSDDEIVRRLFGRRICSGCQTPYHVETRPPRVANVCDRCGSPLLVRADDTAELVQARLRVFHRTTESVLQYYASCRRLVIVSGEGSIAEVDAALVRAFDEIARGSGQFVSPEKLAAVLPTRAGSSLESLAVLPSLDLVLLGGPGSGKGTQAERLSAALHLPHIATGDLFRENLRQGTSLGQLAKSYMDRGELVPDDVTDAIVEERLARTDARAGFILDGFPRTRHQAEALAEIIQRQQRRISAVFYVDVSDAVLIERLSGRVICQSCQAPYHQRFHPPAKEGVCDRCGGVLYTRSDDAPETVRVRLATFHRQTEPVIDFYRQADLLYRIPGEGEVSTISAHCQDIAHALTSGATVAAALTAVRW